MIEAILSGREVNSRSNIIVIERIIIVKVILWSKRSKSNIIVIEIIKTTIILFKTMVILYKEWQGRSNIIIS